MNILLAILILIYVADARALTVIWHRSGLQDSSRYGYAILPLGDQNNDGFNDWAVAAAGNEAYHGTQRPYVEFFHGGNPPSSIPYMTIHGERSLADWGFAEPLGDVNGDGYIDWFIKSYTETQGYFQVSLYWGGPEADTLADGVFTIRWQDWFLSVGDFNRDGFDDLYWYHYLPLDYGEVYYGGSIVDTIPDWSRFSSSEFPFQSAPIAFGDLNGDGAYDFVSGTYPLFTTYIFLGGAAPDTVPAYTWPGLPHWPDGIVKDLNNDGYDELVFGYENHADVHFGGLVLYSEPDVTLYFPCSNGADVVRGIGDINDDGFQDLAMVESYCGNAWWGVLSVYLGYAWLNLNPVMSIFGRTPPLELVSMQEVAGLGDVNGDGVDDLGVGAWDDLDFDGWRGRALVFAGDSTWEVSADRFASALPQRFEIAAYPNPFNNTLRIIISGFARDDFRLTLHNLLGQEVDVIHAGALTGGELSYTAPPTLATGVYFLRATSRDNVETRKIVFMK